MTMIRALAQNLFESIGIVQPRIEVMIRDGAESNADGKHSHMQWVRGTDRDGRRFTRIQWVDDTEQDATSHH